MQGVVDDFRQRRRHLLFVHDDSGQVSERHLNGPIGRIDLRLGLMKRTIDQFGKIRRNRTGGNGLREVHQLRDDVGQPVRLLVNEVGRRFQLRVR